MKNNTKYSIKTTQTIPFYWVDSHSETHRFQLRESTAKADVATLVDLIHSDPSMILTHQYLYAKWKLTCFEGELGSYSCQTWSQTWSEFSISTEDPTQFKAQTI